MMFTKYYMVGGALGMAHSLSSVAFFSKIKPKDEEVVF